MNINLNGIPKDIPKGINLKQKFPCWACQVTWSPDGKMISAGASGGNISIWDVFSQKQILTFEGHEGWVVSTSWKPDGKKLASGSGDCTIKIWDTGSGKLIKTLKGHKHYVRRVAWSPDGSLLASSSDDATIRIWDTNKFMPISVLKKHKDRVYGLAWSIDNKIIASGSCDGTVILWNIDEGRPLRVLRGHHRSVESIAWSPNGLIIASGGTKTIKLWNSETGKESATLFEKYGGPITYLSFSANGRYLASKHLFGMTGIWDCNQGVMLATLAGKSRASSPPDISFHPKYPILATVENDETICLWKIDFELLQKSRSISSVYPTDSPRDFVEENNNKLRIFLCHSSDDKSMVHEVYEKLCKKGFQPWLDETDLLPGQDWRLEIRQAVRKCDVVLVFLSKKSINKEGFVQKEIKYALDISDEKPEGSIYVIPARIEKCEVPDRLLKWQWVNLFEADGFEKLYESLKVKEMGKRDEQK
jgi:WD40 repeat protein